MKIIHASPQSIKKIFIEQYEIPEFQRPYSWGKEQCEKLWDDFVSFFENKKTEDTFFLGTIVVYQNTDTKTFSVIDGQQRLTSLLLLIKSLFDSNSSYKALEKCLKLEDQKTNELLEILRIDSKVLAEDKKTLEKIILKNDLSGNNNFIENYIYFKEVTTKWIHSKNSSAETDKMIQTLLDDVVLLPIDCGSEDDALTMFQTINDRGMSLSDADIFKAKLHKKAKNDGEELKFIEQWNNLSEHEDLFRIYMHIVRAREGETGKEIGLRSFFDAKKRLDDWNFVIKDLIKIYKIKEEWKKNAKQEICWKILDEYPNQYWKYPLYVFLHKNLEENEETFYLSGEKSYLFENLLNEVLKYFYIKGIIYNTVNEVKTTVFNVCKSISRNENYLDELKNGITNNDRQNILKQILSLGRGRYTRGLILLSSYLNPNQNLEEYAKLLNEKLDIEHILPKQYCNYDKWEENKWKEKVNTIGNLIPLEKSQNIKASNEFFGKKKNYYINSKVQDAKELCEYNNWYYEDLEKRQEVILKRLESFFNNTK